MKVLVTGGAGFIGSHLCESLLSQGDSVVAIDILSSGSIENIANIQNHSNFKFYEADLLDIEQMRCILQENKTDIVYHLASNTNVSKGEESYIFDFQQTFETTLTVLKLLHEFSINKLFFSSSSTIYGEVTQPINETNCNIRPISYYGASKLASEAFISAFAEKYNVQVWIVRLANVVGNRMVHGVIPDFVKKLKDNPSELVVLGSRERMKPFVYIDDVINGIMLIIKKAIEPYNVFVIGNDTETSIQNIAKMVIQEMNLNAKIIHVKEGKSWLGDIEKYCCSNEKIKQLGWKITYTSDDAVLKTIRNFVNSTVSHYEESI